MMLVCICQIIKIEKTGRMLLTGEGRERDTKYGMSFEVCSDLWAEGGCSCILVHEYEREILVFRLKIVWCRLAVNASLIGGQ